MSTNIWVDLITRLDNHPYYIDYTLLRLSKNLIAFQVGQSDDRFNEECMDWLLSDGNTTDIFSVDFNTYYYIIFFVSEDDATLFKLTWEESYPEHIRRILY